MNRCMLVLFVYPLVVGALSLIAQSTRLRAEPPQVNIGSKAFTESVILGEMAAHLARHSGAEVRHRAELGGTQILWQALTSGEIDAYVEYTGTIREEILADAPRAGAAFDSEQSMREALAQRHVVMSQHIGFNNTYALGMRRSVAERLNIRCISDLQKHPELSLGLSDEFYERQDGWHPLQQKYQLPQTQIRVMEHNLAYRGLEKDAVQVTDLYTTDPEIKFYDLVALEDDLAFFPTYYAVILMRDDLERKAPSVAASILKMEGLIDPQAMSSMSAQVRLDRKLETVVAGEFLNKALHLSLQLPSSSTSAQVGRFLSKIMHTTLEHLFLVVISLGFAIAIAIPLGIAASRNEAIGQSVLGIVGVIQTLPSMALLVFMMPFFAIFDMGIGPAPAIMALFLYSLLPIVRGTYSGIRQIPAAMRESAEVLGLDPRARLRLVELPLALPSILSGIKTAAVINVGTATIGALIGAGGYGSPILTGIRLNDLSLILQGAMPAAALALVVQYGFGLLEKRIVSPGLQPK
jgi:osmoprotectant transport system permease protein